MADVDSRQKPLVVALRTHLSLPVAVGVSAAIALSGSTLAAAYPVDEPFRERPGSDHSATHRELLFVDPFVADPEQLLIALRPNVETIILEADRGGLEQITEALEQRRDVKAIHIVAHGEAGSLNLAGTTLTEASLSGASELLEGWFTDQPERPEILLYACDLARGPEGLAFIERLSGLAGADVAASTDLTGQGGDWELEYHLGEIATVSAFNEGLVKGWSHTLAAYTVTNTDDSGAGSLRSAIEDANGLIGPHTIDATGITGTIELDSRLRVLSEVVITGPGSENLTIRQTYYGRVFDVYGVPSFELQGVTLSDGRTYSNRGGAMRVESVGEVYLNDVTIANSVGGRGGGLWLAGVDETIIRNSTISGNDAYYGGGGIASFSNGLLVIENSTVTDNQTYYGAGGGILLSNTYSFGVLESTISDNRASGENADGGGIALGEVGVTYISNSTISGNTAYDDGGGIQQENDARYYYYERNASGDAQGGEGTEGHNLDSLLLIGNSEISGNTAYYGDGGGIDIDSTSYYGTQTGMYVDSSSITDNSGYEGGGINIGVSNFVFGQTAVLIANSTISNNNAVDDGGGILVDAQDVVGYSSSYVVVGNSTISHNDAGPEGSGGGIHVEDGNYTILINATVSHNTAAYSGGGIYVEEPRYSYYAYGYVGNILITRNSIISQNNGGYDVHTAGSPQPPRIAEGGGEDAVYYAGVWYSQHSIFTSNRPPDLGGNNLTTDNAGVAGTLQDLGGPTKVLPLLAGSPAINAGNNLDNPDYDQRGEGFDRIKGGQIDIGAFETSDADSDGIPDWQDLGEIVPVPTLSAVLLGALSSLLALMGLGSLSRRVRRDPDSK